MTETQLKMARSRGNQSSGRIHVHEQIVNDEANIISVDREMAEEHQQNIIATEQKAIDDKTRKEYRNRISRIYKWWAEHYPEYYQNGTYSLSAAKKEVNVLFHYKNDRDLVCAGLNVKMVKAYLSEKKRRRLLMVAL